MECVCVRERELKGMYKLSGSGEPEALDNWPPHQPPNLPFSSTKFLRNFHRKLRYLKKHRLKETEDHRYDVVTNTR